MSEERELTSEEVRIQAILKDDIHKAIKEEVNSFKKFAFRSNMIQMAVAFMLGAVFNKFITSLSENIVMPCINFLIGKTGVPWREWRLVPVEGLTIDFGKFVGSSLDFIVISLILYVVYIKIMKGTDLPDKK